MLIEDPQSAVLLLHLGHLRFVEHESLRRGAGVEAAYQSLSPLLSRPVQEEYLVALAPATNAWAALPTLTVMAVVLGIDNLIFISVLSNKLPEEARARARRIGIAGALVLRLGLLGTVAVLIRLTAPL